MVVPWPKETAVQENEITAVSPTSHDGGQVNWSELVDRIHDGDPAAMEELYHRFGRGIRYSFYRHLGPQDLDDKVHDTFVIVVQAIQKGELRDPERLMGFVRTVVRRQVAAHIEHAVHARRDETPIEPATPVPDRTSTAEEQMICDEQISVMLTTLRTMPARDRELLTRFYLEGQTQEQICSEMGLTSTQFRLFKSRAKARFGEKGRRRIERKSPRNFLVRVFSAMSTTR